MKEGYNYAIILSAGKGMRMGAALPKQYLPLAGRPVLYYALRSFADSPLVDRIILVAGEDDIAYCREEIIEQFGIPKVADCIAGGAQRYDSVFRGLKRIAELEKQEETEKPAASAGGEKKPAGYVMIHDGARPFVDADIIERSLACAGRYNACAAGMPVKDTIKICSGEGIVTSTPDRSSLWQVQTPQTFSFPLIYEAYQKLMEGDCSGVTDDAMVVERMMGCPVHMTEGSYRNMKITTPEDMLIAEALLHRKSWIPGGIDLT